VKTGGNWWKLVVSSRKRAHTKRCDATEQFCRVASLVSTRLLCEVSQLDSSETSQKRNGLVEMRRVVWSERVFRCRLKVDRRRDQMLRSLLQTEGANWWKVRT